MKKIIDIKNISMKEKIALLATIAALLMFITKMCYNLENNETNGIDYGTDLNINYMLKFSEKNTDRQIYLTLNEIIFDFLNSYNLEIKEYGGDTELSFISFKRKDYYKVLASSYKKKLGWFKYNSLSKEFMQNFIYSGDRGQYMKTSDILNEIYELGTYMYSGDMYICKLNTAKENEYAYIGIQLEEKSKKYNIFYLGLGEKINE